MFGIAYIKAPPTTFVLQYKNGKIVQKGAGLSFFYFAPTSIIVQVPLARTDVPFAFSEVTADFQDVTLQGELTYRITNPTQVSGELDFSVLPNGRYRSEDPVRLGERLVHAVQIPARGYTQRMKLRDLLLGSEGLVIEVLAAVQKDPAVTMLGVEILGLSILSIKASPEISKALSADAREDLLRRADEAIFARRNGAVDLERKIKENELDTEVAVEHKRRQVRETQMQAEIAVEQQRSNLVEKKVENERKEADARAHALSATLEPLKTVDWRTLMAASSGTDSRQLIALAFQNLAEKAEKIGQLNITPDLLNSLMRPEKGKGG